jgi:hypothetical protein
MRFLVRRVRKAAEKKLGVSTEYLERLGETSFSGFWKFLLFLPVAGHGEEAPHRYT